MTHYEKNFDEVLSRIEAVRLETNEHQIIKIVAVSKYVGAEAIRDFYEVGQRAFGENRVQDMKAKAEALEDLPLEWHFIGRLQTNKINALLDISPALIQSCEDYKMAVEIDKRAAAKGKKQPILLQINSAREESKAGIAPEKAVEEYLKIYEELDNVTLKGVMTIGAHTDDEVKIRESFETTFKIYDKLRDKGAKYCSMGMSNDFELAVRCGSNMLRLGSILFK
ncbi:MAG TPA: YggS family pyridoxal phosphate-dependent enzyme [Campylobacteraceae bacterium]|nr:YggS family pyridoxal phosphate-dependent enzyme [Campylobacteraceae bacterium]